MTRKGSILINTLYKHIFANDKEPIDIALMFSKNDINFAFSWLSRL